MIMKRSGLLLTMAGAVLVVEIPVRSIVLGLLIIMAPLMSNPWAAKSSALVVTQMLDPNDWTCGPSVQRVSDR